MSPNAGGGGPNEYVQINFGDLTPYFTYMNCTVHNSSLFNKFLLRLVIPMIPYILLNTEKN